MHDADPALDELVGCCRWLAEARAARDPQQTAAALGDLYRHLQQGGWTAPARAALLVRLQSAALDAALHRMLSAESRQE